MVNPVTVNLGIIVPLTGADVDTWGEDDVNPNMVALDGLLGGVQTIALNNVPVTLTSPAGFVATPSAGPTQSQNRVLKFTGTLTGDVLVTLPLPGVYVIDYAVITGNFVTQLRASGAGDVIALPPGSVVTIYCDGTNVKFVDLGKPGDMELWSGLSAMPRWVTSCSKAPYLLSAGSTIYNFSDYPYLGPRMGSAFGGNGITTFGVPDMAGRVPLAYDGTGTRITVAGCGINGQTMGASADNQSITLGLGQIPAGILSATSGPITVGTVNSAGGRNIPTTAGPISSQPSPSSGGNFVPWSGAGGGDWSAVSTLTTGTAVGVQSTNTLGGAHPNVQPAQVTGIWVVKT